MKSCLGMLLTLVVLIALLVTGLAVWHLSETGSFTRKEMPAAR